jgi:hypothetical protein
VRLRQLEAEQMQHADDEVEEPRHPQIEHEIGDQVLKQVVRRRNFRRRQRDVVVEEPVEDQVDDAADDPVDAFLVGRIGIAL